jgi:hypothetical protein
VEKQEDYALPISEFQEKAKFHKKGAPDDTSRQRMPCPFQNSKRKQNFIRKGRPMTHLVSVYPAHFRIPRESKIS